MSNELVIGKSERKHIFITLRVLAKDLKLIFQELSALYKKTAYSKSIIFKSSNNILCIRASSNIEYVAYPTNLTGEAEDFEIACLFKDIHEILESRGEILLTITPTYVEIQQEERIIELTVVDYIMPTLPRIDGVGEEIKTKKIVEALKTLLKLAPASAVYQKQIILLLSGGIAQVRFPSIWIETDCEGLVLPMDQTVANIVLSFLLNTETAFLLSLNQWTAITKGISTLFIPIKDDVNLKSIEELTKDYSYIGEFSFRGFQTDVQKLLRAVGKVDAKVYLFERAIRVEVRTTDIHINHLIGKDETKLLDSFTMRLEFLNAVLMTLGETVKVYGEGDYRCIKAAKARVLISSQG